MKPALVLVFWQCSLLLAATPVFADVVTLKGGRQISGQIESGATREIRISVDNASQVVAVDQIQSIQFSPPAPLPAPSSTPPPAAAMGPQSVTLPVGTEIAIRTIDRIDSKKADLYREYAASLDDPVTLSGLPVLPVNTKAILRITDLQRAGFKRPASLSLALIAVTISGQRANLETGKLDSQSGSQGKRTLAGAGIGAGTGAAIGALAGGGIGAAVGATVGGAGGAIVSRALGKGVEIAPETRFSFHLTQPVVISYQGGSH